MNTIYTTLINLLVLSITLLPTSLTEAQVANRIIVKFTESKTDQPFLQVGNELLSKAKSHKTISHNLRLGVFEYNEPVTSQKLRELRTDPQILNVWYDQKVSLRSEPNDPLYEEQYGITLSQIDQVWDYTTGGYTQDGKQIVVAVLDDGFDLSHEDMQGAFWINNNEIPGNNIDDDLNGYVDDVEGLNVSNGNDSFPKKDHGTSVTGIIGARGNNDLGISGVNWDVKILPIKASTISEIIEGYEYILQLRRRYNQTGGSEGAFIGVTSLSAGFENEFPVGVFAEWCEMYDLMGEAGILSFGATANQFVDVDVVGDIPTLCSSDYFVGVTTVARGGKLDNLSAYGKMSVDLAAPGNLIISPSVGDNYDSNFTGTSAATPMAAGVAALLLSAPCTQFAQLIESSPREGAKFIKKVMVEGVTKSDEMTNLYLSGGYLNARRALTRMIELCDDQVQIPAEIGALRITETIQFDNQIRVYFVSSNEQTHFLRWVDPLGREILYKEFIPQSLGERNSFIDLPLLRLGTAYLSLGNGKKTVSKGFFFRGN